MRLREAAKIAGDYGVILGVQNHHDLGVTAAGMAELLSDVNHPNIKALFDPWSIALTGGDLYQAARQMAPLMVQTTLADYVRIERFAYRPALVNYERRDPDWVARCRWETASSTSLRSLLGCAKAVLTGTSPMKCARSSGAEGARRTSTRRRRRASR